MEIHGHRGCRGYYPENTIEGFLYAIELGATAIELDIVVSKDKQLIVSHEPWMNHLFCETPLGKRISEEEQLQYNLYEITVEEIQQYNCGARIDDKYPDQLRKFSVKPTLQKVVDVLKPFPTKINIEVKSEVGWYGTFQPQVEEYAQLVADFLERNNLYHKCMVQSFDVNFLNAFQEKLNTPLAIGFLVEDTVDVVCQLKQLNFTPTHFNPDYKLLTHEIREQVKKIGIKTFVWTVNDAEAIEEVLAMEVDGIISDYPDRVKIVLNQNK